MLGAGGAWRPAERGTAGHLLALPGSRAALAPAADDAGQPDDAARPDVIVRVLGRLDVQVAGVPVASWGGQRTRTLFQYLLMRRRPVHREVLMELLWPGHTYSSARNNLNVCVYGLRRAWRHLGRHQVCRVQRRLLLTQPGADLGDRPGSLRRSGRALPPERGS